MKPVEEAPKAECDVFFFEVGGQRYGTDPIDVLRVDRLRTDLPRAGIGGQVSGTRSLVVRGPRGEVEVLVDRVLGVRRLLRDVLRPVPPYLAAVHPELAGELLGVLVEGDAAPVLVLDLKHISARAQPVAAGATEVHG
jgi:hypothetical protein